MTCRNVRTLTASFLVLAALAVASTASADEKGTQTMKITTVVGKAQRPSVVIEISRAKPEIKLSNLQDPAVETIVRAASKAPF